MGGSLPYMRTSFCTAVRMLFLKLELFSSLKLPPSGHSPAFRNQTPSHRSGQHGPPSPSHFFSWLCGCGSPTGQGFRSPPRPTATALLCMQSLDTWFSAWTPPAPQPCSGRCGLTLDWRLPTWGRHLRFRDSCFAQLSEASCVSCSPQSCIIITTSQKIGSEVS